MLITSFTCFLTLSYVFYGLVVSLWNEMAFAGKASMISNGENYYLYLQIMDFIMLLFIRTRISILYFSKIITLMNIIYLFYCFNNFLPLANLAAGILICLTFVVFSLFIKYCEVPAMEQNPFGLHVPSINEPRQVYSTVSMLHISLGIDVWSIFFAPSFRSEFTAEEQKDVNDGVELVYFDFSQPPNL